MFFTSFFLSLPNQDRRLTAGSSRVEWARDTFYIRTRYARFVCVAATDARAAATARGSRAAHPDDAASWAAGTAGDRGGQPAGIGRSRRFVRASAVHVGRRQTD